jgi:ribosomal protein S20
LFYDLDYVQRRKPNEPQYGRIREWEVSTPLSKENKMKLKDFLEDVEKEIQEEDAEKAKGIIKERLREVRSLKTLLNKAEKKLEELVEKDVEEIVDLHDES